MPLALSTKSNPSTGSCNFIAYPLGYQLFDVLQLPANSCAGCAGGTTSSNLPADFIDVAVGIFGPHANSDAAVLQFFKQNRHDDGLDTPNNVDQPIGVSRLSPKLTFFFEG